MSSKPAFAPADVDATPGVDRWRAPSRKALDADTPVFRLGIGTVTVDIITEGTTDRYRALAREGIKEPTPITLSHQTVLSLFAVASVVEEVDAASSSAWPLTA